MSKVIVNLGYRNVVLDADKAVALATLVADAEIYQSKYHSKTDTQESHNTHHIYMSEPDTGFTMQLLTNEAYNLYKLAGKPDSNY